MRIYLSAPITGLAYGQMALTFIKASKKMKKRYPDAEIVNPIHLNHSGSVYYEDFMFTDIKALKTCSHIYFCTFWKSPGMKIESIFSKKFGIKKIKK